MSANVLGHADVLLALYKKVRSTIDARSVAREMFQSNALTLKELQSIQSKHSEPVKAAEQLLNIVMIQSDNVYGCFLDALKKTGHQHVFEVIVSDRYKGTHNVISMHSSRFSSLYRYGFSLLLGVSTNSIHTLLIRAFTPVFRLR